MVTNNDLHRFAFKQLLQQQNYALLCNFDAEKVAQLCNAETQARCLPEPDVWLVDISEEGVANILEQLLEHSPQPIVLHDEAVPVFQSAAYQRWSQRLLKQLASNMSSEAISDVKQVWVLAASTGGPEAVKRFLAALPAKLPIAMVYAQHIETGFEAFLSSMAGDINVCLPQQQQLLKRGEVLLVSSERQMHFLPFGRVVAGGLPWSGVYQPNIDQVIAELAHVYREHLGVIVFSGMCDDGAVGCRVAKGCGAKIWVQAPASCISDDMPQAALATGCVDKVLEPEALAAALAAEFIRDEIFDLER